MTQTAGYMQYYDAAARAGKITGIDISTAGAQYPMNFVTSYSAGARFVIMKTGNGTYSTDANFTLANVNAARAAGLKVGFYHYSYPITTGYDLKAAKAEADAFCNRILTVMPIGDTGEIRPTVDVETTGSTGFASTDQLKLWITTFINQVKLRINRQCFLYTNYFSIDESFPDPIIAGLTTICPLWLAAKAPDLVYNQPPSTYPNYNFTKWGDFPNDLWRIWQFSSDGNNLGATYGASSAHIDVNISEGDLYSMSKPSTVTLFKVQKDDSQLTINWTNVVDTDLHHYNIYLDGVKFAEDAGNPYIATGLINGHEYSVQVSASDLWEEGEKSNIIKEIPQTPAIYGNLPSKANVDNNLGTTLVFQAATNDYFYNNGDVMLFVKNGSGATITATIDSLKYCNDGYDHDIAITINAGVTKVIAPLDPSRFNNAASNAKITFSSVTSVTIAAVNLRT